MTPAKHILLLGLRWHEGLIRAIVHEAAERRWHINLGASLHGMIPRGWTGDGIIGTYGVEPNRLERLLRRVKCPAVGVGMDLQNIGVPSVLTDGRIAGRLAAEHFLDRGFRSFALNLVQTYDLADQRHSAFKAKLREHGYTCEYLLKHKTDPDIVWETSWQSRLRNLRDALRKLPKPLAVYCDLDHDAVWVIEACQAEGLAVPEEVAVLGTLDMPLYRESSTVPLSSIAIGYEDNARLACDLLHRMMDGKTVVRKNILTPPKGVVTRRSTDTVACRDPQVTLAIRFMLDHYHEPIKLVDIARATGVSKSSLYEAFHKDLGRTPLDALTFIRLNKAKQMLRETNRKVHNIATACGFGFVGNLYHHFKQSSDVTPIAYRKQSRV
jgi:LacI family transcriptional regulator